MLREFFQAWPQWATDALRVGCFIVAWRLWMFTIKPWLRPDEPRDLPYWLPFIGHTFRFYSDYVKLIEDGLNYTGRKHEPFTIQLLGTKLYVCTDPRDVSTIFDNTVAFGFDDHLTNLLTSFGISKEALKRAWHVPKPGDWCYIADNPVNPKQKSLIHAVEDVFTQQLLPGDRMDVWASAFLGSVKGSLRGLEDLQFCTVGGSCLWCQECTDLLDEKKSQVSLYRLVSYFSVQATCQAMFGSHLFDIDDRVIDHMLEFNEHVWMIVFRRPSAWGALPVEEPHRKLIAILRQFVARPEKGRSRASWAIKNILKGMEITGIDMESRAAMLLMIFWAAVSNEHNSCFWLLAHLFYDESLLELVKTETSAAWRVNPDDPDGEPQLDVKYLCANCPNLESAFHEVLRLNNTAAAVRVATERTILSGDKAVPRGGMLVIPFRQLHTNEGVWGDDVDQFRPTRFLEGSSKVKTSISSVNAAAGCKEWKDMTRHASFRPFGGGATYCPGRTLAKHEVFGFTAILLRRFDISLAQQCRASPSGLKGLPEKLPFPRLNSMTPSFGLNGPIKGQDMIVNITERAY